MNIALFCATKRGYAVLHRLLSIMPPYVNITVFSFREEAHEPPFMDDIRHMATTHGAAFYETRQLKEPDVQAYFADTPPDLMLTVNWRYMIPPAIYERAVLGAYVFHDSLLPKYRGFSPTVWAMVNGERETGATLFEMGEGFDTGAIVGQQVVAINDKDTIATIFDAVTDAYLILLERHLPELLNGTVKAKPQYHPDATYCCKRLPEDNLIDWTQSSEQIYNLIRAVTAPYPGAYTYLNGRKLIVWSAQRLEGKRYIGSVPGRVVEFASDVGAAVATGDGVILLVCVQVDDGAIVSADKVLNKLSFTLRNGVQAA